jgi:hypothetical protein
MGSERLARLAPLTGVAFVVLIVVAILVGGETPDTTDSRQEMVEFWTDNESAQIWSSVIGAWATVLFVWFAASLRSALRRAEGEPGRLAALSFAGAVIGAIGLLCAMSFTFAAADAADDVPGSVTQTLTVLGNGFFLPIAGGYALFFLATGVVALRTRVFPVWLGWVSVVLGIVCLTPVGFFALLLGLVWILGVSVLLYRRESGPVERSARMEPSSATPG